MRTTWLAALAGFALAACGGSVTGLPGGPTGSGGSTGTGGHGTGGSGTGGYGAGGSGTGGYGAGGSGTGGGPDCCASDANCAPDQECAGGRCMPLVNGCWRDADCGPNAHCQGAMMCPCGTMCGGPDTPGSCVPNVTGCCLSDSNCATGEECVDGRCEPPPPAYQCWRNSDCPFGTCSGVSICPCGVGVACTKYADQPGYCPIPDDAGAP